MKLDASADQDLVLAVADSWDRLLVHLENGLGHLKGISFAEYRLLRALAVAPRNRASRVDLAQRVAMSASGVTRALRPLEKLGFVRSERDERDARLTLSTLTSAGIELVTDASAIVDDIAGSLLERSPAVAAGRASLVVMLAELAR